jgi:cobaltochelatase CobS
MTKELMEAARFYDPKDGSKTDARSTIKLACDYMDATISGKVIVGYFDKTLYNMMKTQPLGTLYQLLNGDITPYDLSEWMIKKPRDCTFKTVEDRYIGDEKWPERTYQCLQKMEEYLKDGTVLPLGPAMPDVEVEAAPPAITQADMDKEQEKVKVAKAALAKSKREQKKLQAYVKDLQDKEIAKAYEGTVEAVGEITGTTRMVPVSELFFGCLSSETYSVPVWTWVDSEGTEVVNPNVPFIDPNYIFEKKELERVLYSVLSNQPMYLHGHTGTGKTTLIQQVNAHLFWQTVVLSGDSDILRTDLVGKTDIVAIDGVAQTKWTDGLLPAAISSATCLIVDEVDFMRPDTSYIFQPIYSGDGMVLLEDNGRKVNPHSMFRIFATANTVGQGDEHGMYQGARVQSLAQLDRFKLWMKKDYLPEDQRLALIKRVCPTLSDDAVDCVNRYTTEHETAFIKADIIQPITPRGMLAVAKAVEYLENKNLKASFKDNMEEALSMVILDRANKEDYAVLKGLIDRVIK